MDAHNPYQSPVSPVSASVSEDTYMPEMFSFKGRIGRLRYLAYSFGTSFVLMMVAGVLGAGLAALKAQMLMMAVLGIMYLGILVFTFALTVRRLNDMNLSGWLSLLMIVPLVNLILWLALSLAPGSATSNNYGLKPAGNTRGVWIAGLMVPVGIFMIGILAAIAIPAYQDYVHRAKERQMQMQLQQP